jgi:predicted nucleic acid-binding protein
MFLVDSSFYINHLRATRDFRILLQPHVEKRSVLTCGLIRLEVLRGIRVEAFKREVAEFFAILADIPLDGEVFEKAIEIGWKLDRRGIVLPATDIIIGAAALAYDATVITTDSHFKLIPGLSTASHFPAAS